MEVDDIPLGSFGPFPGSVLGTFSQPITISIDDLAAFLVDGGLQVKVDFGTGVEALSSTVGQPSFSAHLITYSATDANFTVPVTEAEVPEPASVALLGLGIVGLAAESTQAPPRGTMIHTTNDSLKIGTLTMIAGLRVRGRVTGIAKDGRTVKYSVRYIVDGRFREAVFGREQLTMIARLGGKDV